MHHSKRARSMIFQLLSLCLMLSAHVSLAHAETVYTNTTTTNVVTNGERASNSSTKTWISGKLVDSPESPLPSGASSASTGTTSASNDGCDYSDPGSKIPESGWVIEDYKVDLKLGTDGELLVSESIKVNFEVPKHGIYRYIPLVYQPQGEGFDSTRFSLLDIRDVSVTLDGGAVQYDSSVRGSSQCTKSLLASLKNNELFLKIGDPDVVITGIHQYVISYTVGRALRDDRGVVEFYWNAVPQFWGVPIQRALVTLTSDAIQSKIYCYRGAMGSEDQSCGELKNADGSTTFDIINLNPYEGVSILTKLDVPKSQVVGNIDSPWTWVRYVRENTFGFVALAPLLLMLWLRYRSTQGITTRGIVAPRYDAPDQMTPAQVGLVADQSVDEVDISAIILSLAVKGYLKIKREQGGIFGIGSDWVFIKTPVEMKKKPMDLEESTMYGAIFSKGGDEVSLKSLRYTFAPFVEAMKEILKSWGVQKSIFRSSPSPGSGPIPYVFGLLIGLAVLGFVWGSIVYWVCLFVSAAGIVPLVMTYQFYTSKGKALQEEVQGLKMYMQTAEKDRMNYLNAPERTPELFERLLPYAMALGVVEIWADQFKDIFTKAPEWYVGSGNMFVMHSFTRDLTSASASFVSTMTAVRSSSSGGGFGGGGGGFSGGGG
ncbi:MAG: DUF2207 domain-containing protein, partial [bacterium]